MIFAPHTLELWTEGKIIINNLGDEEQEEGGWVVIGKCRCVDNDTHRHISVNGKDYTYSYNIIFEGERIDAGSRIRVKERGVKGEVVKASKCNYFNYSQVWL